MCNYINKLKGIDTVTGYKVAVKKDGKYYSPAIGIEYKLGPVEIPKKQNRLSCYFTNNILDRDGEQRYSPFKSNHIGNTAVFVSVYDAYNLRENFSRDDYYQNIVNKYVILKMSLKDNLWEGTYCGNIYMGATIISMEEVEE